MINPNGFLMIEPPERATPERLDDALTQKVIHAWRSRTTTNVTWRGQHICACGAMSDNRQHYVKVAGELLITNSLCVHYVMRHRASVPPEELAKVQSLPDPPRVLIPTAEEERYSRG